MKKYIKRWFYNTIGLGLTSFVFSGLSITSFEAILLAGLVLTIVNLIVKPIIKVILLPITIITLGMLRWVIDVISLALVIFLLDEVIIGEFNFPGFTFSGFVIPPMRFPTIVSILTCSILYFSIRKLVRWLTK